MKSPYEIEGWMQDACISWLTEQARESQFIIEVGSWKGKSTAALVEGIDSTGEIVAVDAWVGVPDPQENLWYKDPEDAYQTFLANMAEPIDKGLLRVLRMQSELAAMTLLAEGLSWNFIFIDADHSYGGVKADITNYLPLVTHGGIMAGHDWGQDGVTRAVQEAFGSKMRHGPESIWYVEL